MRHSKKCAAVLLAAAVVTAAIVPASAQGQAAAVRKLTIDEAVKLALEQNLGIQIERLNPQIGDVAVAQARSYWVPTLTSTLQNNSQNTPASSFLSGGQAKITDARFSTQFGINQVLPTGANYSVDWNSARATSSNLFTNFNPLLSSNVAFSFSQPLLRGRTIDSYRQQLQTTRKDREAADVSLRATIATTTRNVKLAYWDLAFTRENLSAQQTSLDLAKRALADNEKRVQIGTMAPIDIVEAQAEVARNEESVIVAEAAIKQAEDRLRALILDPASPDFWTTALEPGEQMPFAAISVDVEGAIRKAIDSRTDVSLAKNSIEKSDINLKYFRSQVLPEINANVSYQSNAVGGSQLSAVSFTGSNDTPRSIIAQRNYGSVLGDVFSNQYPTWTVGVSVAYPLGGNIQQTNLARAKLQYSQAGQQLRNLEMQIGTQVRDAARQVTTNAKRVESARVARDLSEQKLAAEEKKFAAGIQISFFVFQAQRDLAQARTNEIKAIADYNKSVVDFEAIQETSLTGNAQITSAAQGTR